MTPDNQIIPKEEKMRHIKFKNVLIVLAVVSLLAVGMNAFAGWGRAHHYGPGPGWHQRGWGAGDYSYNRWNLSEDTYKKMDEERQAFYKDTEALRQKIYEKELALRSELAKETPDAKRAAEIQKEISELTSQFDQKRLDHMIRMRGIVPYAGKGYGMGGGPRGYGMGRGPMGYGGGWGSCWR
jgi:hypothetical protein